MALRPMLEGETPRANLCGGRGRALAWFKRGLWLLASHPASSMRVPSLGRISEGRSITVNCDGHSLVCQGDYGYIRRIGFHRMPFSN
jgi:hypothetical protein